MTTSIRLPCPWTIWLIWVSAPRVCWAVWVMTFCSSSEKPGPWAAEAALGGVAVGMAPP
ncbi:hypothetical protein D3C72_2541820 [compost metagenome]